MTFNFELLALFLLMQINVLSYFVIFKFWNYSKQGHITSTVTLTFELPSWILVQHTVSFRWLVCNIISKSIR